MQTLASRVVQQQASTECARSPCVARCIGTALTLLGDCNVCRALSAQRRLDGSWELRTRCSAKLVGSPAGHADAARATVLRCIPRQCRLAIEACLFAARIDPAAHLSSDEPGFGKCLPALFWPTQCDHVAQTCGNHLLCCMCIIRGMCCLEKLRTQSPSRQRTQHAALDATWPAHVCEHSRMSSQLP